MSCSLDRCALLMAVVVCIESVFLVENPSGSCLLSHPRLAWLFQRLRELEIGVLRLHTRLYLIFCCFQDPPFDGKVYPDFGLKSAPYLPSLPAAKAFRVKFWMSKFNSPTPKRTMVVSNSRLISGLEFGDTLESSCPSAPSQTTCVQYTDSTGAVRYKGDKEALKRSQTLKAVSVFLLTYYHCPFFRTNPNNPYFLSPIPCEPTASGSIPRNLPGHWLNWCPNSMHRPVLQFHQCLCFELCLGDSIPLWSNQIP